MQFPPHLPRPAVFAAAAGLACLPAAAPAQQQGDAAYSWQQPHAKVLPTGDLEWQPRPFAFAPGESVRYIDFEDGDDADAGTSRDAAWKHHPWDRSAAGNAAAASGVHTYVFKRGVTYRGTLAADESGEAGNPIRLTSDPSWGDPGSEAVLAGSRRLAGEWKRGDAESAPGFPDPQKVWYLDVDAAATPHGLWEVGPDGAIARVPLARDPNWTVTNPDDVKSDWHTWNSSEKVELPGEDGETMRRAWAMDPDNLTDPDPKAFDGATVWTEYVSVMGQPYPAPVEEYDPARNAIRVGGPWGQAEGTYYPIWMSRYYMENLPRFLDAAGEWYYAASGPNAGRLYVRLPGDRDPNGATLELAERTTQVDVRGRSHVEVTGLAFRFGNVAATHERWWPMVDEDPAGVKLGGNSVGVTVANNTFEHVPLAVWGNVDGGTTMDGVTISDNDINQADYAGIDLNAAGGQDAPGGVLTNVRVLRNRITESGMRPRRAAQGHTLTVNFARTAEIAGNIIHRAGGAGLWAQGGKGGSGTYEVPLARVLIHHNKVTDTLLWTNDYGGIETWQSGPFYVYNNISGNPGGYWHFGHMGQQDPAKRNHASSRFGFAYYFDGSFKNYVFNNIAWGKTSDLTSPLAATTAFHEVIGFLNTFANNTAYRFAAPFRRQAPQGGRGTYIGNVIEDAGEVFFRHADLEDPQDVNLKRVTDDPEVPAATLAYADNVFFGEPRVFGYFNKTAVHPTLQSFSAALKEDGAIASEVGVMASASPLRNPAEMDFRLSADSAAKDAGVKHFVPWGLASTVGEWHFRPVAADPNRLLGDHWFMTGSYTNRETYRQLPRNDLRGQNLTLESYVAGPLEDWVDGALKLNGEDQHASIAHGTIDPEQSLDMGTNSFIIEAYLRTEPGHTGGVIASKMQGQRGYALRIDEDGGAGVTLGSASGSATLSLGPTRLNDGEWHHLLVEFTAEGGSHRVQAYVDGEALGAATTSSGDLSNGGDFVVGRGFAGEIDFLRVARGTLEDAKTTIDELYAWQFDGPFLRDFLGKEPVGQRRDAGAIEADSGADR